ncbi:MAG: lipid-A-disaccharide synthase [candidate division WOR-3 bacterium]
MPKIFFSVGEISGDLYAGPIINHLIKLNVSPSEIFAIGGPTMKQTGIQIIKEIGNLQVFGFAESILSYCKIRKHLTDIKNNLYAIKPDIFVPVSFSGFNLPLLKFAKYIGSKVVYLGPPQIWAWAKFRIKPIKKYCNKVICLFPFEHKFYQQLGVNSYYLGNPLTEYVKCDLSKQEISQALHLQASLDWLTFMPGSRPAEINAHLPLILKIIRQLQKDYPGKFEYIVLTNIARVPKNLSNIYFGTQYKYELMAHSKFISLCSGTASLEATILNVPFISFYRLSPITYLIAKTAVKIPYFTLTNILANKKVVQEFAQPKFRVLYKCIKQYINNESVLKYIQNELKEVKQSLILPNSAKNIARAIIE